MQHEIEPALRVDQFSIDFDMIAFAWLEAEIVADVAIDGDAAGRD
jgi:hypothetical protein